MVQLLKFEWNYHFRQVSTWALLLIFTALGFMMGFRGSYGGTDIHINGSYAVTYAMALLSLGSVFIIMVLSAGAVLRDSRNRMEEMIFSTPVKKWKFLLSKFIGLYTASVAVLGVAVIGHWAGTMMPANTMSVGTYQLSYYLWPFITLILPSMLFFTVVLFAVPLFSKNMIATYTGGFFIYALYMVTAIYFNSPLMAQSVPATAEGLAWAALVDPFGISAYLEQSRYWTAPQRNTRLLVLGGNFLLNRLVWVGLAGLLLGATYNLFAFRSISRKGKKSDKKETETYDSIAYSTMTVTLSGWKTELLRLWTRLKVEVKETVSGWAFPLMLLVWVFLLLLTIVPEFWGGGEYRTDVYPTTFRLISSFKTLFHAAGMLLLVFYSAEIIHREKESRIFEIIDAMPVSSRIFFAAKYIALAFIPLLLLSITIGIGIGFQLMSDFRELNIPLYLSLFYYSALPLLLLGMLGMCVQTVTDNKYLGMAVTLIFFLLTTSLGARVGLQHPVLRFAVAPDLIYSDMNGSWLGAHAFHWFMLYWGTVAALLAWISLKVQRRGTGTLFRDKLKQIRIRWNAKDAISVAVLLFFVVGSGSYIYYNTNILNEYITLEEQLDWQAAYEKRYKVHEDMPEPTTVDIKSEVVLYPSKGRYRIEATYRLENKEQKPISQIWFTPEWGATIEEISVEKAQLIKHNEEFGTYWFELDEPLQPGEQLSMSYTLSGGGKGFKVSNSYRDDAVSKYGSYLMEQNYAPRLGYRSSFEIDDNAERLKRGLAEKELEAEDARHLAAAKEGAGDWPWVHMETTISTVAGQLAIAPGELTKQWEEGGRDYYQYKTEQPVARALGVASAPYKVDRSTFQGIDIELYHDGKHSYNIDHIMEVTKQTLGYASEHFGAYPFDHLRIVEAPSHWPGKGYAMSGVIVLGDDGNFLVDTREEGSFDLVAKRTAHEVAHQWWGHQVYPGDVEGASLIIESLAKYMELVMLRQLHGRSQTQLLQEHEINRYLEGRAYDPDPEVPLMEVDGQNYLSYGKGYLAMNAMVDLLGVKNVNKALRQLIQEHRYPKPQATSMDLLQALYGVAAPAIHPQIDGWFKEIMLYDLSVKKADITPRDDGAFEASMRLNIRKHTINDAGKETPVGIDDSLYVGIFGAEGQQLYYKKHRFAEEQSHISVVVDKRPASVGIDPSTIMIDKVRIDNIIEIK